MAEANRPNVLPPEITELHLPLILVSLRQLEKDFEDIATLAVPQDAEAGLALAAVSGAIQAGADGIAFASRVLNQIAEAVALAGIGEQGQSTLERVKDLCAELGNQIERADKAEQTRDALMAVAVAEPQAVQEHNSEPCPSCKSGCLTTAKRGLPGSFCKSCGYAAIRTEGRGTDESRAKLVGLAQACLDFYGSHEAFGDHATLGSCAKAFDPIARRAHEAINGTLIEAFEQLAEASGPDWTPDAALEAARDDEGDTEDHEAEGDDGPCPDCRDGILILMPRGLTGYRCVKCGYTAHGGQGKGGGS